MRNFRSNMSYQKLVENTYKSVKLSQGTLRYLEFGKTNSKPPLLFIHGAMMNPFIWKKVASRLENNFRCVIPELPLGGHGVPLNTTSTVDSVVSLMREFVDAMKLGKVVIIRNNTGGALTQVFLSRHTDCVEKLVLTNCETFENFFPLKLQWIVWMSYLPGFSWLLSKTWTTSLLNWISPKVGIAKEPFEPELATMVDNLRENDFARRDFVSLLQSVSNTYTLDAAKMFPSFKSPVLIVWGEQDGFFSVSDAKRLANTFPHAKLVTVPDAQCLVQHDAPDVVASSIENFMKE